MRIKTYGRRASRRGHQSSRCRGAFAHHQAQEAPLPQRKVDRIAFFAQSVTARHGCVRLIVNIYVCASHTPTIHCDSSLVVQSLQTQSAFDYRHHSRSHPCFQHGTEDTTASNTHHAPQRQPGNRNSMYVSRVRSGPGAKCCWFADQ